MNPNVFRLTWTRDRHGLYVICARLGAFHASCFKHTDGLYHMGAIWEVVAIDGVQYRLGAAIKTKKLRDAKAAAEAMYVRLCRAADALREGF